MLFEVHICTSILVLYVIDLIRKERVCKRCSQNQNCMIYYKSIENGTAVLSGMENLFNELTAHLSRSYLKYFAKWYHLLLLEASHTKSKSIWEKSSVEFENKGQCFSGMVIVSQGVTSDNKLHYTFQRKPNHFHKNTSLKNIGIVNGDRVIISHENKMVYNITTGMYQSFDLQCIIWLHNIVM